MNIIEISQKFPNDLEATKFFESFRWNNKPRCVFCGSKNIGERNKDNRFHCKNCQKSFSVTTGTFLHNTRLPLNTWLFAFSIVKDAKKGLSALQLQRNLNISYPTALSMYHKIRDLMSIENDSITLDGVVEMDETFIGGKPRKQSDSSFPQKKRIELDQKIKELKKEGFVINKGKKKVLPDLDTKRGRGSEKKTTVTGIVTRDGNVVAEVMKTLSAKNLINMVQKYVDTDESVLFTDAYKGYNKMDAVIEHVKLDHAKLYSYKGINTNTIESFWAFIKRQIMGQHHHVSVKYLPKYVAETVFKFNNRNDDDMFETLVMFSMLPSNE